MVAEATWDGDTLYGCAACRGRCMQTVQNVLFAVPRRTAYVSAGRFLYDSGPTVTGKAVRGAADPEGGKRAAHAQERTVFSWSDPSQVPACARMPRQASIMRLPGRESMPMPAEQQKIIRDHSGSHCPQARSRRVTHWSGYEFGSDGQLSPTLHHAKYRMPAWPRAFRWLGVVETARRDRGHGACGSTAI